MKSRKEEEEIAKLFNTTESMITKKYEKLRSKYRKEKNKISSSMRSGCGTAERYQSKWEWFKWLHFLDPTFAQQIRNRAYYKVILSQLSVQEQLQLQVVMHHRHQPAF